MDVLQSPGECADKSASVFGGADSISSWRIHHNDALPGGRVDINVVNTGSGATDDLQTARRIDDVLRISNKRKVKTWRLQLINKNGETKKQKSRATSCFKGRGLHTRLERKGTEDLFAKHRQKRGKEKSEDA